jgi:hypothetical protein
MLDNDNSTLTGVSMPYYNIVDGRCYVVKDKDIPDEDLYEARDLIAEDAEFKSLTSDVEDEGFVLQVQVDSEIGWLGVYLGKLINDDNHSYQGKIITFKKNDADHIEFETKVAAYDQRVESILSRLDLPHTKDVGIVFNQWD